MSQDLENAIDVQRELHGRIARAYGYLKKLGADNLTKEAAKTSLQSLESNWKKFEKQHVLLCSKYGALLAKHDYITSNLSGLVKEDYLVQKSLFLSTLKKLREAERETHQQVIAPTITPFRTTLPKIQLHRQIRRMARLPEPLSILHRSGHASVAGRYTPLF